MAGKDGFNLRIAQVDGNHFAQDITEIGCVQKIAAFVELVFFQARPAGEHGLTIPPGLAVTRLPPMASMQLAQP